jgi:hypothetical protein
MPRARLVVERMSDKALWGRAFVILAHAHPVNNRGPKDLEALLEELDLVLHQLKLRGQQLSLLPSPDEEAAARIDRAERAPAAGVTRQSRTR